MRRHDLSWAQVQDRTEARGSLVVCAIIWAIVAILALGATGGCGGDDPVAPPVDPLAGMYGTYNGTLQSAAGEMGFIDPMVLKITGGPNVEVTLSGDQLVVTNSAVTGTSVSATCQYGNITFTMNGARSGATISGTMNSGPVGNWPGSQGSFQVTRGRSGAPVEGPALMDELR